MSNICLNNRIQHLIEKIKLMRGVKVLLKYILEILYKGREIVIHSTTFKWWAVFFPHKHKNQNVYVFMCVGMCGYTINVWVPKTGLTLDLPMDLFMISFAFTDFGKVENARGFFINEWRRWRRFPFGLQFRFWVLFRGLTGQASFRSHVQAGQPDRRKQLRK